MPEFPGDLLTNLAVREGQRRRAVDEAYRSGWVNGRRRLVKQIETWSDEEGPGDIRWEGERDRRAYRLWRYRNRRRWWIDA